MTVAPFGDDVVHQPPIMRCREHHGLAGGSTDVQPVHPRVAGEDLVDQEAEGPLLGIKRGVLPQADEVAYRAGARRRALTALGATDTRRLTIASGVIDARSATCAAVMASIILLSRSPAGRSGNRG